MLCRALILFAVVVCGCTSGGGRGYYPLGDGGDVLDGAQSGDGSGGGNSKCALACRPPSSDSCMGMDPTACINDCVTRTTGLTAACAECIVEHSGWSWETCTQNGSGNYIAGYHCTWPCGVPGNQPCNPQTDVKCEGYVIAKITDSACKALCP